MLVVFTSKYFNVHVPADVHKVTRVFSGLYQTIFCNPGMEFFLSQCEMEVAEWEEGINSKPAEMAFRVLVGEKLDVSWQRALTAHQKKLLWL